MISLRSSEARYEAFVVLKIKEFAKVNDCIQDKNNEEVGHYGQTLNNK